MTAPPRRGAGHGPPGVDGLPQEEGAWACIRGGTLLHSPACRTALDLSRTGGAGGFSADDGAGGGGVGADNEGGVVADYDDRRVSAVGRVDRVPEDQDLLRGPSWGPLWGHTGPRLRGGSFSLSCCIDPLLTSSQLPRS